MRLLKALLLTLTPPVAGLSLYYRNIYDYSWVELATLIGPTLWYYGFYWVLISLVLNYLLLWRLKG